MTENEIIEMLEVEKAYMDSHGGRSQSEALAYAIESVKEIQQYRAIGTIEEFKALKEKEEIFDRNIEFFNKINLEVRNKAIDEFAERLKSDEFQKYNLDIVFETSRDLSYSNCVNSFCEYIDEIAEEMRGAE